MNLVLFIWFYFYPFKSFPIYLINLSLSIWIDSNLSEFILICHSGRPESDSDSKTQNSDKIWTTFYWKFWQNSNQVLENSDYKYSCLDWRWYYIHTHRDGNSVTKSCFYKIRLQKRKYCKVAVVILNGAKSRTICLTEWG